MGINNILEEQSGSYGVSEDSKYIEEILEDLQNHIRETHLGQGVEEAYQHLKDTYQECSQPNWDRYNAKPISHDSYLEARKVLALLPVDFPLPEIVPEPNGNIGFEWEKEGSFRFLISISGKNIIVYAGLFGEVNETCGTEKLSDSLPSIIIEHLQRLFQQKDCA